MIGRNLRRALFLKCIIFAGFGCLVGILIVIFIKDKSRNVKKRNLIDDGFIVAGDVVFVFWFFRENVYLLYCC